GWDCLRIRGTVVRGGIHSVLPGLQSRILPYHPEHLWGWGLFAKGVPQIGTRTDHLQIGGERFGNRHCAHHAAIRLPNEGEVHRTAPNSPKGRTLRGLEDRQSEPRPSELPSAAAVNYELRFLGPIFETIQNRTYDL